MVSRGIFFAHRDLDFILNQIENKKPFYLYTGRGPASGSLHLGHLIPLMFTQWFQNAFDCPVIIQMTDDEKYLWKEGISEEELEKCTLENIKDVISVGFDPSKTFIFRNADYMKKEKEFYYNVLKMWKHFDQNQMKSIFGISSEDNIGKTAFPAMQGAPSFSNSFPQIFNHRKDIPCLIPCAIDQDPYFQMTRDVAPQLGYMKPSLIYSGFLPSLQGAQNKMSGSDSNSCIRLSDTQDEIEYKINRSFTGWNPPLNMNEKMGGDCDTDVAYQFLRCFEENDALLEDIKEKYEKGQKLPHEIKKLANDAILKIILPMQNRREKITDETVQEFTAIRELDFNF